MRKLQILVVLSLLALASSMSLALGPVDVEAGIVYWDSETDFSLGSMSESFDSEDIGYFAEGWFGKWGAKGAVYNVDFDDSGEEGDLSIEYTSLDLRRKLFAPSENNFFALGVGWQKIKIDTGDGNIDTNGFRLAAEGRVGLVGVLYIYGDAAYYFSLDDFDSEVTNPDGWELEFGLSYKPAPFVNLRAGYRTSSLDFDIDFSEAVVGSASGSLEPSGFLVGVSVNF